MQALHADGKINNIHKGRLMYHHRREGSRGTTSVVEACGSINTMLCTHTLHLVHEHTIILLTDICCAS